MVIGAGIADAGLVLVPVPSSLSSARFGANTAESADRRSSLKASACATLLQDYGTRQAPLAPKHHLLTGSPTKSVELTFDMTYRHA